MDGLRDAARRAISEITSKMSTFEQWHEDLHTFSLTQTDAEALTFRMLDHGVLSPGKFAQFRELFFLKRNKENNARYDNTLYGFHGAMTQLWNKNSLIGTAPRHQGLVKLLDQAKRDILTKAEIRN